ncbi:MAG TPA: nucleotide exchange factor GrpE [Bacteroidota bacterium]|nr:nucleotide exchange factor GrpE [Bacteroidota bacterium]
MAKQEIPDNTSDDMTPDTGANSEPDGERSEDALRAQLAEAQAMVEGLRDQLLRKAAEFENYKRRSEADFGSIIKNANESLLLALLPVLDDFGRSLGAGRDALNHDALLAGVEMIRTKFLKALEKQGVVPFESTGKPFDVDYHDALLQVPRSDMPPNTVIQEVEPGYMLHDRVLRHAKVIVSTAAAHPGEPNGQA